MARWWGEDPADATVEIAASLHATPGDWKTDKRKRVLKRQEKKRLTTNNPPNPLTKSKQLIRKFIVSGFDGYSI